MAQTVCGLPRAEDRERLLGVRRGSRSSAQSWAAGAHCPLFGRPLVRAGSGAARERQPTRGLALASAIRRAGYRRPAARQDELKIDLESLAEAALPVRVKRTGPPHLSIVVLPFVNLAGDAEQDYFVDGVTESSDNGPLRA